MLVGQLYGLMEKDYYLEWLQALMAVLGQQCLRAAPGLGVITQQQLFSGSSKFDA